ncbi:MAG: dTDP-4-dehydrorhamnose 3,5-epimerase [Alicyclobacillus sp.]|nr:dTDP-4-dehydrorhamnose 3,5-epimerase [Alicyclobacillus sp.]
MKRIETGIDGVFMIEPDVFGDERGFFTESYTKEKFEALGITDDFIQDNHSFSAPAGTLRGLHYQLQPAAQTKLVRVVQGAIYDVVVDIRKGSPTFGKWVSVILTGWNHRQLYVPKGFAHGFCTLVPDTHVMHKVDAYYSPEHDRGIRWDDPALGIPWPMTNVVLSEMDKRHPVLAEAEMNF